MCPERRSPTATDARAEQGGGGGSYGRWGDRDPGRAGGGEAGAKGMGGAQSSWKQRPHSQTSKNNGEGGGGGGEVRK
jgi:hypothetical protein